MGQMAKIPRLFPDLEKILFFPDIFLTRGNPALALLETFCALTLNSATESLTI